MARIMSEIGCERKAPSNSSEFGKGCITLIFKSIEFDGLKSRAGSNTFAISPSQWVERTGAIGMVVKMGRYGSGVFAHEEIAMEFATWLSPEFRLYVLKEFKRLKEIEAQQDDPAWTIRCVLAKANYRVHTDAVKDIIIPSSNLPIDKEGIAYADEAELLNRAVFGMTSQEWCKKNPSAGKNGNIRDHADIVQLTIISNLQSLSAVLTREGLNKMERFYRLSEAARFQYDALTRSRSLAEQGKPLMQGLKPLDAPRPPLQEKPPASGRELTSKFKSIKDQIANLAPPPIKEQTAHGFDEVIKRIVRVPPPQRPDKSE